MQGEVLGGGKFLYHRYLVQYVLHIAGILHVKTKQIVFYKGGKKKRRLQFSSSLIFMCQVV